MKHEEECEIARRGDEDTVSVEDTPGYCQHLQALGSPGWPFRRCKQAEIVRLPETTDSMKPFLRPERDGLIRPRPEKGLLIRRIEPTTQRSATTACSAATK